MTTQAEALDRLIAAVEAGAAGWYDFPRMVEAVWGDDDARPNYMETIRSTYHGSLDSAKALHDALLPGWGFKMEAHRGLGLAWVGEPGQMLFRDHQSSDTPARAWLLAILRAYRGTLV